MVARRAPAILPAHARFDAQHLARGVWLDGGYGYRGGGYYERGYSDTDLNPHSRVEQRPYGSWGGGPRGVAYGFRAARTADQ